MEALKKYLVLPREVTAFEQGYLTKMNKIALYFFYAHIPVFMLVAWVAGTGPLSALVLTVSLLIVPTLCQYVLKGERAKSMVYGITAMCMGGLLVHFGQGAVQIEMHFYFFALLAMLCIFANPTVNIAAAVTVALHHLVVWLLHPVSVFNYEASYWVVAVHAGFVVLETVAACFISRRFFDDVIGLEKIVQARTKEVHLILNNIGQGFMTVDLNGVMSEERSSIVTTWFGESGGSPTFFDYIRRTDATAAEWFQLGLESLREDVLPVQVSLGQLPKRIVVGSNTLELTYKPIHKESGQLEKLLVIISDITSIIKREQVELQQKQLMQIFENIMRDKLGFLQFLSEADGLMESVIGHKYLDLAHLKRIVHTIKGNAGLFGMSSVATLCHELENEIVSEGKAPEQARLHALQNEWNSVREGLDSVLGKRTEQRIEINDTDYEAVLRALLNREHPDKIAKLVRSWKLEAGQRRLEFVKDQAKSLAQRMGKKDIEVSVQSNNIRFDGSQWASFWSSLTHVLRNAIDHGIETEEERSKRGKAVHGSIRIETAIQDGKFVVAVEDDGRGIDWDAIATKAMQAQLPHKSQQDLMSAIFQDGISTKGAATQFSGRGVGMGVVREECTKRGGQIEVNSQSGQGTRILFRFPLNESVYQEESSPKTPAAQKI